MSDSMKAALLKTKKGEQFLMKVRQEKLAEKERYRQLKELVHSTFVVRVPDNMSKRWDVYKKSQKVIRELAKEGGEKYNRTMHLVKHAFSSYDCKRRKYNINIQRRNYRDAIMALGC